MSSLSCLCCFVFAYLYFAICVFVYLYLEFINSTLWLDLSYLDLIHKFARLLAFGTHISPFLVIWLVGASTMKLLFCLYTCIPKIIQP